MAAKRTSKTTPPVEIRKGERTRAALMDSAYRLFIRQGFNATSMRQIADGAGLALGGIYNHFGSKEDVFLAMLKERHPFLQVLPAMQSAQGETVDELVRDAAARMLEVLEERGDMLNLMFVELVEFKGQHVPELFEAFFPPLMEFAQRFAQARGPLRDIPLPVILRSFIGLFYSYYMTERLIGSQLPPEAKEGAFESFVDIFLRGILDE